MGISRRSSSIVRLWSKQRMVWETVEVVLEPDVGITAGWLWQLSANDTAVERIFTSKFLHTLSGKQGYGSEGGRKGHGSSGGL